MKKIIIVLVIFLIGAIALFKLLSQPSLFEIASEAELHGKYAVALENYIKAVLDVTEAITCPDKSKAITITEEEWIQEVERYLSWISYSVPYDSEEFNKAIEGINRCTLHVDNENFITEKKPKELIKESLAKEWISTFVRKDTKTIGRHEKLMSRAIADSVSFLRIRAMTGYIYNIKLIDLKTGKKTDVILYPNSNISLLVRPGEYFLICSSEVQFTEGLSGKTWRSPENIIPITTPNRTSLHIITLKTRVSRKK